MKAKKKKNDAVRVILIYTPRETAGTLYINPQVMTGKHGHCKCFSAFPVFSPLNKSQDREGGRAAYLVQTGHAIVVHQPRVGPVRQQEPCDFGVPTVAGPVQSGGAPVRLGITLSPAFQQELAHGIVPVAAGIVLQGTESEVRQQSPGRRQDGGRGRARALEQAEPCSQPSRAG